METITSVKNEQIKALRGLAQKKNRDGLLLCEGEKCVAEALSYAKVDCIISDDAENAVFADAVCEKKLLVTRSIMEAVSDAKTPQHVIAAVRIEKHDLPEGGGLFVALEDVSDPGNVGTIIRTADAAGAKAVILSKGCADCTAPKVVRGTMGSLFHLPVIVADDLTDALAELKRRGTSIVAAHLRGNVNAEMPQNRCIVIGNESRGLTDGVSAMADVLVRIPMPGKAESLNAAVAASILMYKGLFI